MGRLSAGVRLPALAGALTGFAVLASVVPLWLAQTRQSAEDTRSTLGAMAAAGAAGMNLQRLGTTGEVDYAARLDAQDAALEEVGAPAGLYRHAVELCAIVPNGIPVVTTPFHADGRTWVAACAEDAARVVVAAPADPPGRRALLLIAAVSGLLATAIVAERMRALLAPLQTVTEAARALARGERPKPIPPPTDPEVAVLAAAVDTLGVTLAAREDEIQGRLALMTQVGAVVAHEVRNPLQSIGMLADLVAGETDPAVRARTLEQINQELALVDVVVQRLLAGGKDLKLVTRPTDLRGVARGALDLLRGRAREGHTTLALASGPPCMIDADAPLLRRAVENLVQNAVAVGARRVDLCIDLAGARVFLHVDDDGPGIAEADRSRVFQPGVSLREGGTGWGLPLARKVAEAHGGRLTLAESPLGGARFTLELPVHAQGAA